MQIKKGTYVALVFFLGAFGIHKFYAGKTGQGIIMAVLTCTVVGGIVTGPWAMFTFIRSLCASKDELGNFVDYRG